MPDGEVIWSEGYFWELLRRKMEWDIFEPDKGVWLMEVKTEAEDVSR